MIHNKYEIILYFNDTINKNMLSILPQKIINDLERDYDVDFVGIDVIRKNEKYQIVFYMNEINNMLHLYYKTNNKNTFLTILKKHLIYLKHYTIINLDKQETLVK